MKTNEEINFEAAQDAEELRNGNARYSTRGEEILVLILTIVYLSAFCGLIYFLFHFAAFVAKYLGVAL